MSYPWPLSTRADVEIDADEILDYVRDNKEWFVEKLQGLSSEREIIKDATKKVAEVLDKFDYVRRFRDKTSFNADDPTVKLYNVVVELKNYLESQQ